jgi:PAS domain S-box-containing protein
VELVSARVALAIERARAREEAARAHERLRFLNDAGVALNATLDYRETTQRLADLLTPTLGAACAIYLLEEDGLLRKAATRSPAREHPDDLRAVALERMLARLPQVVEARPGDPDCAIGGSVHALTPVFERVALTEADDENDNTASIVNVPIVVRQHALGGFCLVAHADRDFTAGDMPMLQGLAERAAVAIDNARLYLETQEALATGGVIATQLDTIFNATDVGIFVTDVTGAYLRVNPYGAALLGLVDGAGEAREDEPPFELRTPEGELIPPEHEPLRIARTQGRPVARRVIIHRRGGSKDVEALIRCTPWRDTRNQIAGAVGVFTDITAISALERQKDEFIGIASHELKTPLTSLKILAQLLGRKLAASGDAREQEQAERMNISIIRMERLIGDLLDVSLMQEGRLALSRRVTDLGALCADAIDEQRLLTQRVINYHGPEGAPLLVYADPERIRQVVTNLLSNALKYSPAKEPVFVRAYRLGDECVVSVHDHGSGVPDDARDHIFDRFFRVPGMQVQSGSGVGLGLGLNISREIISRHDGRIWAESEVGHGSVFSFALPRSDTTPTASAP